MSASSSPEAGDVVTEHIPWEQLTIQPPKDRRMLWYGIAAGVLVVGLLAVVISRLGSSGEMQPVMPAAAPAAAVAQPAPPPAAPDPLAVAPAAAPAPVPVAAPLAERSLLSEADLMASGGDVSLRSAAAGAEWFVLEFFTLDPSEPWLERVTAASGMSIPAAAAPVPPGEETVSYVEWTRARSVEQIGADRFRVSVLMRRMVARDGLVYRRLPAEEAVVEMTLEPDGAARAASLPVLGRPAASAPRALSPETIVRRTDETGVDWPASVLAAAMS